MAKKHKNGGYKGRGGWRGGGRPKGSKNKQTIQQNEALEYAREKIRSRLDDILEVKIKLALGERVWHESDSGKAYLAKPDNRALTDLIEIVIGKPTQTIEHKDEEGTTAVKKLGDDIRSILETKNKDPKPKQEKKEEPKEEKKQPEQVTTISGDDMEVNPEEVLKNG